MKHVMDDDMGRDHPRMMGRGMPRRAARAPTRAGSPRVPRGLRRPAPRDGGRRSSSRS